MVLINSAIEDTVCLIFILLIGKSNLPISHLSLDYQKCTMELNEICLIITQLPEALIYSDVDYNVAAAITRLLSALCYFARIVKKAMCGVVAVTECQ